MSILLESLNQSGKNKEGDLPGLSDNHFDDEMLSDEWLLKKIRVWKAIAFFLLLCLVVVSITFYVTVASTSEVLDTRLTSQANMPDAMSQEDNSPQSKIIPVPKLPQTEEEILVDEVSTKEKYIPKKVPKQVVNSKPSMNKENGPQSAKFASSESSVSSIVDFESLSKEQQLEMPDLEISSYAVSSNQKKSFVVLNGAFYAQGETIAPNLKLIRIEKESIIVRYHDQLIRKKYGS